MYFFPCTLVGVVDLLKSTHDDTVIIDQKTAYTM